MRVTLLVAGDDRGEVNLRGHRGSQRVLARDQLSGEGVEPAADLADHHVPDGETDLRVHRVDVPGAGDVAGDGRLRGRCGHGVLPLLVVQVVECSTTIMRGGFLSSAQPSRVS